MANSANYKMVTGMGQLEALLTQLPVEVRGVVLASAVTAASKPLMSKMKQFAGRSTRTGALRASIGSKIKTYQSGAVAVAVVGPDRSYYAGGVKVKGGSLIPSNAERPAHYAHLIEFGHHAVVPRKGTSIRKGTAKLAKQSWVQPVPFVRPATVLSHVEMAAAFDSGVTKGIEKAIKKIKSAGA